MQHLAQNWRLKGTRYALETRHCAHCGAIISPSRRLCAGCQTEAAEHYMLNGTSVRVIGFPSAVFAPDDLRQAAR